MLPPLTTARRSATPDEGAAGVARLKSLRARATGLGLYHIIPTVEGSPLRVLVLGFRAYTSPE